MNSNDIIDKFKDSFKEESVENISAIEQSLLNIEFESGEEVINSIFRNFHTIKGSAGMFGFNLTASLVHEIETVLDPIKGGFDVFNQNTVDATLMTVDFIRELIEGDEAIDEIVYKDREKFLIDKIKKAVELGKNLVLTVSGEEDISSSSNLVSQGSVLGTSLEEDKFEDEALNIETKFYRIRFSPSKGILFHGHKPINFLKKLLNLGSGQVRANVKNIPNLELISADNVYVEWEVKLETEESKSSIEDIFMFLDGQSRFIVEEVDMSYEISEAFELDSLVSNLDKNSDDVFSKESQISSSKEIYNKAAFKGGGTNFNDDTARSKVNIASIKVDSKKLDHLVNLVGELVTIQSKLAKEAENSNLNALNSISAEFSFLINELRDYTTRLRTVPIEVLFVKFQRVVKDLSDQLGKSILYNTQGGDTVLDKSIIERLNEPLVHLIRNSIDHGIESVEERLKLGKDSKGTIKLSAYQSGDSVVVTIEDDGKGLDKRKIIKRAIEKNIISEATAKALSTTDVYNLIFEPGFSTADVVTNISGRGVGMDVVRTQVESLRGNVVLESEFGKYTRTKLIFPLTLAIIEGWLIRVKDEHFIVPISSVESCFEADKLVSKVYGLENNGNVINYRGGMINFIRLREFFGISEEKSYSEHVVVVNTNSGKIGLVVDEILGQHQTVIKTLGKIYSKAEGVSGATILGDGSLALVIDIDAITRAIR
ncbi:chemotaxis protein CheA [Borrelia miyamotoi]|uniref:Chemotaxis protein CheA n=1 Tax=Borrelia miyamotoi TaxID=47466 RepID=A0AAX3JL89_9SPIR|nr:chemotaxis protein CheA [Borrelia miyamotoi]QFP41787.1 chemotaxis protein CheA [Borrelia miyamotoi]QFP47907.1 chemotaxis protein CheA [Borrelia miyamotoi]QGT55667.1 chemotaxis protein CheA [Borrelia miyamotoi]QGT56450.1 chemotaxis protein CheA [Borrelia miyamotoi]WAZ71696.1 chemotaxis protein CheA [Borrelia miyamotoi]